MVSTGQQGLVGFLQAEAPLRNALSRQRDGTFTYVTAQPACGDTLAWAGWFDYNNEAIYFSSRDDGRFFIA